LTRDVKDRLGNLKDGADDVKKHAWFSVIDIDKYTLKQLRAPWIPPIKSNTDTSLFEGAGEDDHVDIGSVDIGGDWDKDF
jgi:protein kinase A